MNKRKNVSYPRSKKYRQIQTLSNKAFRRLVGVKKDPVWGIWLGRKNCIPTTPIYAGLYSDKNEALNKLLKDQPLEKFTHQVEVS